eukprot:5599482-Lingulodinium_polyedra.AAC.1
MAWRLARGWSNAGKDHSRRIPDVAVWRDAGSIPAKIRIEVARLLYIPRLVLHGPAQLQAILQASAGLKGSWMHDASELLGKVCRMAPADHPLT